MTVDIQSVLPCSAALAWNEVQKSSLLVYVAWPLITFRPLPGQSIPERWQAGMTVSISSRVFGIIPSGTRTIQFERIDQGGRTIQTRESDSLVRKWDHLITIKPDSENSALYADQIEIEAGPLTVPVFLFAKWFYWHRHRRWRRVAHRLSQGHVRN